MGVLDTVKDVTGYNQYQEERADDVAEDAGGMFPELDAGIRHATEFTLDNPKASFRDHVATSIARDREQFSVDYDWESGEFDVKGYDPDKTYSPEDYKQQVEEKQTEWESIKEKIDAPKTEFAGDIAHEEVDFFRRTATGVNQEGEDVDSTGLYTVGWTATSVPGLATKGVGAAVRGGTRMASEGALKSARQAMKRPATLVPERYTPTMGAPPRQNAPKGVQGASGNIVTETVDDATAAIGNRMDDVFAGRTLGAVGGVGLLGGAGKYLGPVDTTDNNTGATKVEPADEFSSPYGQVIRLRDNESILGYVTVVEYHPSPKDPSSVTILTDKRGSTTRVSFPPTPQFDSLEGARTAYYEYEDRNADPSQGSQGVMDMGPYGKTPDDDWEQATHTKRLAGGWHLYTQPHRHEDRERFVVAAHNASGDVLYLDSDAEPATGFAAFKEHQEALGAHQRWVSRRDKDNIPSQEPRPDPTKDRPTPADIGGTDATGVLGVSVSNRTLMKAGAAAAALALGLFIFGGL